MSSHAAFVTLTHNYEGRDRINGRRYYELIEIILFNYCTYANTEQVFLNFNAY